MINLPGQLEELKDEPRPDDKVLRMLDKVMNFTLTHFLMEEELMTEANYPSDATKAMVDEHQEFKTYMRLRVLEFREAETFDVSSFLTFLEKFLKTHEFGFDRQLAEWTNQQNETSQAA